MPKNALEVVENYLLYSRKKVKLPTGEERRDEWRTDVNASKRTDDNIDERIEN